MFILGIKISTFNLFLAGTAALVPDLLDFLLSDKHRRETHNLWIMAILFALVLINQIFIIIAAAYFSHIVLDLLTTHGIRLLYPLKQTKFVCMQQKNRIKTGSTKEKALFSFILILLLSGILMNYHIFGLLDEAAASTYGNGNSNSNTTNQSTVKSNVNVRFYFRHGK